MVSGPATAGGCNGHGTHVAGTVGGQTFGVAKNVSLVAVRVLDCAGSRRHRSFVDALDWVIADHQAGAPAVVNLSIGGADHPRRRRRGAGGGQRRHHGCRRCRQCSTRACRSMPAPGRRHDAQRRSPSLPPTRATPVPRSPTSGRVSICSLRESTSRRHSSSSPTATAVGSGTSMATPHVAGAAAVLLSEHPTWTPAQVARDLLADATANAITESGTGHTQQVAVLRAIDATGQRSVRRRDRARSHRCDSVGRQQRRCHGRSGRAGARSDFRRHVGVVVVRGAQPRNSHPVDRGLDLRHHARGVHGCVGRRPRVAGDERRAREFQRRVVSRRGWPQLPRGRRRWRWTDRVHRVGIHVGACVVRAVGSGAVVGVAVRPGVGDGGWVARRGRCAWWGLGDGVAGRRSWWCAA